MHRKGIVEESELILANSESLSYLKGTLTFGTKIKKVSFLNSTMDTSYGSIVNVLNESDTTTYNNCILVNRKITVDEGERFNYYAQPMQ